MLASTHPASYSDQVTPIDSFLDQDSADEYRPSDAFRRSRDLFDGTRKVRLVLGTRVLKTKGAEVDGAWLLAALIRAWISGEMVRSDGGLACGVSASLRTRAARARSAAARAAAAASAELLFCPPVALRVFPAEPVGLRPPRLPQLVPHPLGGCGPTPPPRLTSACSCRRSKS
jgi:hypothetical protein